MRSLGVHIRYPATLSCTMVDQPSFKRNKCGTKFLSLASIFWTGRELIFGKFFKNWILDAKILHFRIHFPHIFAVFSSILSTTFLAAFSSFKTSKKDLSPIKVF